MPTIRERYGGVRSVGARQGECQSNRRTKRLRLEKKEWDLRDGRFDNWKGRESATGWCWQLEEGESET